MYSATSFAFKNFLFSIFDNSLLNIENKTPCRAEAYTVSELTKNLESIRIPETVFPLCFLVEKVILFLRCGRSPLCRCLYHLRRCRRVGALLHCRCFIFYNDFTIYGCTYQLTFYTIYTVANMLVLLYSRFCQSLLYFS